MVDAARVAARLPKFVVFEGVDGIGKSRFAHGLSSYYRDISPQISVHAGSFPGSIPGSLGEWVYRLHHGESLDLKPEQIAPPALQLLHVAAHVDAVITHIEPALLAGGYVILDRYWWSTYAYSRQVLEPPKAWALVEAEHPFWEVVQRPTIVYLTRFHSLKAQEIDQHRHDRLARFYREVIQRERRDGVVIHEVRNDSSLEEGWEAVLAALDLPYRPMK